MKIVHIISGLNIGGAELMMCKLLKELNNNEQYVINLNKEGVLGQDVRASNTQLINLNINQKLPNPIKLLTLIKCLKKIKPDVIQTWMVHSDLLGGIAGKIINVPVIWNIRHTKINANNKKYRTSIFINICALLSKFIPKVIISNSESGKLYHIAKGYSCEKIKVIPNGFDVEKFKPDNIFREKIRNELGVSFDVTLIGLIGRFDELKDHDNYIKAASIISLESENVKFLMCGHNINEGNKSLMMSIINTGRREKFILLNERNDIPELMNSLDILVSSSKSEGFPNTVGEAMACGIPCIVTDVGDSAYLLGKSGCVVPSENPELLAQGCIEFINMSHENKNEIKVYARERILSYFDMKKIALKYYDIYKHVVND